MSKSNIHISIIEDLESLRQIRNKILRSDLSIDTCFFPFDEISIHLGLYLKEKLVSIISFSKQGLDGYNEFNCWQFRGMATLTQYSKSGYGKKILEYAIKIVKEKKADIFWCNARKSAIFFYKKNKFEIISDEFIVPLSGPHYKMILKL